MVNTEMHLDLLANDNPRSLVFREVRSQFREEVLTLYAYSCTEYGTADSNPFQSRQKVSRYHSHAGRKSNLQGTPKGFDALEAQ